MKCFTIEAKFFVAVFPVKLANISSSSSFMITLLTFFSSSSFSGARKRMKSVPDQQSFYQSRNFLNLKFLTFGRLINDFFKTENSKKSRAKNPFNEIQNFL